MNLSKHRKSRAATIMGCLSAPAKLKKGSHSVSLPSKEGKRYFIALPLRWEDGRYGSRGTGAVCCCASAGGIFCVERGEDPREGGA